MDFAELRNSSLSLVSGSGRAPCIFIHVKYITTTISVFSFHVEKRHMGYTEFRVHRHAKSWKIWTAGREVDFRKLLSSARFDSSASLWLLSRIYGELTLRFAPRISKIDALRKMFCRISSIRIDRWRTCFIRIRFITFFTFLLTLFSRARTHEFRNALSQ